MSIYLPTLPFSPNALEPYISQETMDLHYDKHHRAYVDRVNRSIKGSFLDELGGEELMRTLLGKDPEVYNYAAQAWNHSFYWKCLSPNGESPSSDVIRRLGKSFKSFEAFKNEFSNMGRNLFASGWVWLTKDKQGLLKIRPMANAGNPLVELDEIPILACDLWEHAYYLNYQYERSRYLENFWQVVNWNFVEENLEVEFEYEWEQPIPPRVSAIFPDSYAVSP